MRYVNIFSSIIIAIGLVACTKSDNPVTNSPTDMTYNVYDRYYYIGRRPAGDSTMFYWTTSKARFDSLFDIFVIKNPTDTIPRNDFAVKNIVSFVKYGYNQYTIAVDTVTLSGGTLDVRYTSSILVGDMTSTVAQSVIITTYAQFDHVEFIENGTKAGEITRMHTF